ncbi:CoA-binding protein [Tropicimonas sp.]|uniref:CoA-binding protein n=1 Tax=Tropicimonas sp. TaxID=2067044 RepID=UPI003A8AADAF
MLGSDDPIRRALIETRTIACIGASANPARASRYVSEFLVSRGYRVIGVNPGLAGQRLFGETVAGDLAELSQGPAPVDMIDIFRASAHVLPVVERALECLPDLRVVWMQIGVRNAEAAALAEARGITVMQDCCPMVEYPRYFGDAMLADLAGD